MEDVRYMISEASKRVGVESHTLRYWEDELNLPIGRNEMGHRYYKNSDIELLITIKQLKEKGFQLKAIKMLIPNLNKLESLDNQTMIRLKNELNGRETNMWKDEKVNGQDVEEGTSLVTSDKTDEISESQDKMLQFKAIMSQIIRSALKENNAELSGEISTNVTDSVVKEMNFLMRLQEEKEEERYRRFDATLRDYQRSRMHAAAAFEGRKRKKSKFFKKHKVYI
ncbi:MAG TPA: MerR family transcriptional regulator [Clostridiales bacterium]|jgi:DNA-binding transcriptional MerR regulator|nr:MerR family transcriptional regulator [Clostridiales bacterium]